MGARIRSKPNQHSKCNSKKLPSKIPRRSPQLGFHSASVVSTSSAIGTILRKSGFTSESQISYQAKYLNDSYRISHSSSSSTSGTDKSSSYDKDKMMGSDILDGITSLCLGVSRSSLKSSLSFESPKNLLGPKRKMVQCPVIVYPTAKRLDNKELLFERRNLFIQKNLFRSISLHE
jgi:hypothetical protein